MLRLNSHSTQVDPLEHAFTVGHTKMRRGIVMGREFNMNICSQIVEVYSLDQPLRWRTTDSDTLLRWSTA